MRYTATLQRAILHRDFISGLVLVVLSTWIWWHSASFPQLDDGYPGPSLFPRVIAVCLGIAGIILTFKRLPARAPSPGGRTSRIQSTDALRLLAGLTLAAVYPLLIPFTHFIPVMAVIILLVALLLRIQIWRALLVSVVSAALIYGLFTQLLNVPL